MHAVVEIVERVEVPETGDRAQRLRIGIARPRLEHRDVLVPGHPKLHADQLPVAVRHCSPHSLQLYHRALERIGPRTRRHHRDEIAAGRRHFDPIVRPVVANRPGVAAQAHPLPLFDARHRLFQGHRPRLRQGDIIENLDRVRFDFRGEVARDRVPGDLDPRSRRRRFRDCCRQSHRDAATAVEQVYQGIPQMRPGDHAAQARRKTTLGILRRQAPDLVRQPQQRQAALRTRRHGRRRRAVQTLAQDGDQSFRARKPDGIDARPDRDRAGHRRIKCHLSRRIPDDEPLARLLRLHFAGHMHERQRRRGRELVDRRDGRSESRIAVEPVENPDVVRSRDPEIGMKRARGEFADVNPHDPHHGTLHLRERHVLAHEYPGGHHVALHRHFKQQVVRTHLGLAVHITLDRNPPAVELLGVHDVPACRERLGRDVLVENRDLRGRQRQSLHRDKLAGYNETLPRPEARRGVRQQIKALPRPVRAPQELPIRIVVRCRDLDLRPVRLGSFRVGERPEFRCRSHSRQVTPRRAGRRGRKSVAKEKQQTQKHGRQPLETSVQCPQVSMN